MNTTKLLPVLLLTVCWSLVASSQLKVPMWEMPFYFEDENGERDTIYIGVDTAATIGYDTLFEGPLDTTVNFKKLTALVQYSLKHSVLPPDSFKLVYSVVVERFYGKLKVKFDHTKLADTSTGIKNLKRDEKTNELIPDIYSGAQMYISYPPEYTTGCGFHSTKVSIVGGQPDQPSMKREPICHLRTDSIIFDSGFGSQYERIELTFEIIPMNLLGSPLVSIAELQRANIKIYPNPVNSDLHLFNSESHPILITVYTQFGSKLIEQTILPSTQETISLAEFQSGLYFIDIQSNEHRQVQKLIKR